MRLWRRNDAPVGGWVYFLEDGTRVPMSGVSVGLDALVQAVESKMTGLGIEVPRFLAELVEDQICLRQPEGRCRYSRKLGDVISATISKVAGAIDAVAGTDLKPRARGCSKCGKRRVTLNNFMESR